MSKSFSHGRVEYIDIAKGLGMFLVVYAHILLEGPVNWYIYAFHMPLFFFLSGLLFSPERYGRCVDLVKKRIGSLLVPYLFYSVITWLVWAAYSYLFRKNVDSYWMPLLQTFIAQGSGGFLVHNVPLWFVTCLFTVEVLYYFIAKIKNVPVRMIVITALTCLGYCMIEVFGFFPFDLLPWSIEVAFAAIIFYAVGSTFSKQTAGLLEWLHRRNVLVRLAVIALLFAAVLLSSLKTRHVSFGSDVLGPYPYLIYPAAFAGTLMMLTVCYELAEIRSMPKVFACCLNYVKWVGKNSFRFMAIHVPIKGILVIAAAKVLHTTARKVGKSVVYSGLVFIATMVIASLITLAIDLIVRKIEKKRRERKLAA